jgi:hypothetical protein
MKKKTTTFEVGKCYKSSTKDRVWFFMILKKDEPVYYAYYIKKSRYQNYIMDCEMVHQEPIECVEITTDEFLNAKTRVLSELIKNPIP